MANARQFMAARTALWWKTGGPAPEVDGPLTFTAEEPNASVQLTAVGSAPAVTLLTSTDGGSTWTPYTMGETIPLPAVGDTVMFKAGEGGNAQMATSATAYHRFVLVGRIAASGNANSMLDEDFESVIDLTGAPYCFAGLFSSCATLTSTPKFTATSTGESCYYGAFQECSQITKADFPLMPAVGGYAFFDCTSLSAVSFPVCTLIGSHAFEYCSSLRAAVFPCCTTVAHKGRKGGNAFYGCTSLSVVSFPVCTLIGQSAFYGCTSLSVVSFPACTDIGPSAFYGCTSLSVVSFPACTKISNYAFFDCTSLSVVSFPVCTTISAGAFRSCSALVSLFFRASNMQSIVPNVFSVTNSTFRVCVPTSLVTYYQTLPGWSAFASQIEAFDDWED